MSTNQPQSDETEDTPNSDDAAPFYDDADDDITSQPTTRTFTQKNNVLYGTMVAVAILVLFGIEFVINNQSSNPLLPVATVMPLQTVIFESTDTPVPAVTTPLPPGATPPAGATATPLPPGTTVTPSPPGWIPHPPTPAPTPLPGATATPLPAPTATPVPLPTATSVPLPTDTPVPLPTATPLPVPTDTPVATLIPTLPPATGVPASAPPSAPLLLATVLGHHWVVDFSDIG